MRTDITEKLELWATNPDGSVNEELLETKVLMDAKREIEALRDGIKQNEVLLMEAHAALLNVNKIVTVAAEEGFRPLVGDWANNLFESQQVTSSTMRKIRSFMPDKFTVANDAISLKDVERAAITFLQENG